MLLAIDVGNTQTTLGLFDGEEMLLQSRVPVYQLGSTASVTF